MIDIQYLDYSDKLWVVLHVLVYSVTNTSDEYVLSMCVECNIMLFLDLIIKNWNKINNALTLNVRDRVNSV